MDEKEPKEQVYEPILPPPEEEKPEEGFVPYCGSEEAESAERNPNRKLILLLVLIAVFAAVILISIVARKNNYYHAVLQNLRFDYQEGEAVFDENPESDGSLARALSEEIGNKNLRIDAAMYMFDEKQNLQNIMTEYTYTHNNAEDVLEVKTGSENALFMKSFTYRRDGVGYQKKSGSTWKADPDAYVPKLNEYFFGTENHNGMFFACQQSSKVSVSGRDYTCELWLMEDNSGSQTVYTTIYRYYDGSRLAGVRILFDFDTIMEVYDVKNYVIG